jgi:hypothetical protein
MWYLVLIALVLVGCGKQSHAPTTQESFLSAFRHAYDAQDREAMALLVWWTGVPDDLRSQMGQGLAVGMADGVAITDASFVDYAEDSEIPTEVGGRAIEPSLQPRYWLIAKYEGQMQPGSRKITGTKKLAVGLTNGCFFICAARWKKSEQDGAANGSQPIRSETNRTSSAAGSRR